MEIAGETTVTTLGYAFIALMGILTIFVSSRFVALPIILTCFYITIGQVVLIGPFHFSVFRIMILAAWFRLIIRREISPIGFNAVDKTLIIWAVTGSLVNILLLNNAAEDAMVNRLGFMYDTIGIYFFFRIIIRSFDDVDMLFRIISVAMIPLAIIMLFERTTGRNIFSIFGGVPEISWFREGEIRAQGPFRNPIIAGTFGATSLPLFVGLWWQDRGKPFAVIGVAAATLMTVASASGGPASAFIIGIASLLLWKFQKYIKTILWSTGLFFLTAHMLMQAPVWYLMMKMSNIVGGGGWHRAYLIDMAIAHFNEWWLYGTNYTAHWMPYVLSIDPNHADITNQYILQGIRGGLVTMVLFIAIIVIGFRGFYHGFMAIEEEPFERRILLWTIGASLATHAVTFTSVSYFDQMIVFWYMVLALISWSSNQILISIIV